MVTPLNRSSRRKQGKVIMRNALIAICVLASIAPAASAQFPGRGGFDAFFGGRSRLLVDLPEVRAELGVDDQQAELLVDLPEVRTELGVDDQQAELLDALQEDLANQRRAIIDEELGPRSADESVQRLQAEARLENLTAFDRRSEELLAVVLEPKQAGRLAELYLQRDGIMAIDRPEIATKLELSDEQKQRLQSLRESLVESRLRRSSWGEQQRPMREKEQAGLRALLNEEQQTRWQELLGKPFEFPASSRRGPRIP